MAGDVGTCEHDWRRGPMVADRLADEWQTVCVKCWVCSTVDGWRAQGIQPWTEQDYWRHLDEIEGERAPDLRRTHAEGKT